MQEKQQEGRRQGYDELLVLTIHEVYNWCEMVVGGEPGRQVGAVQEKQQGGRGQGCGELLVLPGDEVWGGCREVVGGWSSTHAQGHCSTPSLAAHLARKRGCRWRLLPRAGPHSVGPGVSAGLRGISQRRKFTRPVMLLHKGPGGWAQGAACL